MRRVLLVLIFLDIAALGTIAVLFFRSAEAEHRTALAEEEERECHQRCWEVADACEKAVDACLQAVSGGDL